MTKKQRKKKDRQEEWNDLLLPILCVLCIMPFCIRLAEYDYGYSHYLWHTNDSIAQDLYAYYRSYFFDLVAIISLAVLAFRMGLYREKTKPWKIYLPLAVYSVLAVLSSAFSVNKRASLTGNFYQFQSIFVLIGFCLMSFYAYQIMETERDYRTVAGGITVTFLLISVTGWFQVFGHDLLNYRWVQRLVMSKEEFDEYGGQITDLFNGNNVFLTLYNPNYAAVFLVMCSAIFAVIAYGEKEKKKKAWYSLLLFASLILLWFTYTRAALAALVAGAIVFLLCEGKRIKKSIKYILPGVLILVIVLAGADALNGFKYLSRMTDEKKETKLEDVRTEKGGITITYDHKTLTLILENGKMHIIDGKGKKQVLKENEEKEVQIPFPSKVPATVFQAEEGDGCVLQIDKDVLEFVKTEEGYFYRNEVGKLDQIREIPKVDMHGMEYLGSGRLYIWSRVLPILKNYLLVGSGPDTFAEVYPQNDYVGKILYAGTSRRVIESAHNDYLTRWVQTGFLSLLALLVFYLWFFVKCIPYYRQIPLNTRKAQLGFGCFLACICYLVCCLFSDSTLYTTPFFFIYAGIALAATEKKNL